MSNINNMKMFLETDLFMANDGLGRDLHGQASNWQAISMRQPLLALDDAVSACDIQYLTEKSCPI